VCEESVSRRDGHDAPAHVRDEVAIAAQHSVVAAELLAQRERC